ncbi:MAG: hypothetical protein ACXWNZ_18180 [Vulcanimicrobiaceae bacterium]
MKSPIVIPIGIAVLAVAAALGTTGGNARADGYTCLNGAVYQSSTGTCSDHSIPRYHPDPVQPYRAAPAQPYRATPVRPYYAKPVQPAVAPTVDPFYCELDANLGNPHPGCPGQERYHTVQRFTAKPIQAFFATPVHHMTPAELKALDANLNRQAAALAKKWSRGGRLNAAQLRAVQNETCLMVAAANPDVRCVPHP